MTTQAGTCTGERAATRRPASRRDGGFTFVELMVTIVLMGTIVVALLAATQALIMSSRTNREAAAVESALLAVAEQIERAPRDSYQCEADLRPLVFAAAEVKLGLAADEVEHFVETGFQHLAGDTWTDGACPLSGFQPNLVQRIHITITSPDNGLRRTLEVIKGDV
jgi:prepilin-type N-terminal cleavage/methylation domain-containing protein